jgi:hypothetical protein
MHLVSPLFPLEPIACFIVSLVAMFFQSILLHQSFQRIHPQSLPHWLYAWLPTAGRHLIDLLSIFGEFRRFSWSRTMAISFY